MSFESRKGASCLPLGLDRAAMQRPRVLRDLLMFAPSLRLSPVAPVALDRSDPARSMRFSLAFFCTDLPKVA